MPLPLSRLRRSCLLVLVLGLIHPAAARAQGDEFPYAVQQLKTNGATSFAKRLLPHDLDAARRFASQVDQVCDRAGNLLDWEVIDRRVVSSRLTRATIALHFETIPVFLSLGVYRTESQTLYLEPKVSRVLEDVLPDQRLQTLGAALP